MNSWFTVGLVVAIIFLIVAMCISFKKYTLEFVEHFFEGTAFSMTASDISDMQENNSNHQEQGAIVYALYFFMYSVLCLFISLIIWLASYVALFLLSMYVIGYLIYKSKNKK